MHVIKLPKNSSAGRKLNSTGQIFFYKFCGKLDSKEFVENEANSILQKSRKNKIP